MTLPSTSILHDWITALSITESPRSYQVLGGLAILGGLAGRQVYFDQVRFRVYPSFSTLFVGPSGVGKDVIINQVTEVVHAVQGGSRILEGKTIEFVHDALIKLSAPAQAWILAPELTAFLGGKDYQKGLVQDMTNLLSNNNRLSCATKTEPDRVIQEPTISMLAGSTPAWLQRATPDGTLEGGFIPRFIVVYEEYNARHVPMIKYSLTKGELEAARGGWTRFIEGTRDMYRRTRALKQRVEMVPDGDARELYEAWYVSRFERYDLSLREISNRSRDGVLRLAMCCALSRGRLDIEGEDMQFAIAAVDELIPNVALAIRPQPKDALVVASIRRALPGTTTAIVQATAKLFSRLEVLRALELLGKSGEIENEDGTWRILDQG